MLVLRRLPWSVWMLGALYLLVLAADLTTTHDYFEQHRRHALMPPLSSADGDFFLLGTDRLGRDVLARLLHGGRVSLGAGLLAGLMAVGLGTVVGGLAGLWGGWVDTAVLKAMELFMALPWLYLILAVRASLPLAVPTAWTLVLMVLVIGVLGWVRPARLVRDEVRRARQDTSFLASRGLGARNRHLLWYHLLPPTRGVILVQTAILVPRFVLAEVTLSFLGLGVAEPVPSWGTMLAALRQQYLLVTAWWLLAPAFALIVVVLSYHHLTRVLQQRLDVRTLQKAR